MSMFRLYRPSSDVVEICYPVHFWKQGARMIAKKIAYSYARSLSAYKLRVCKHIRDQIQMMLQARLALNLVSHPSFTHLPPFNTTGSVLRLAGTGTRNDFYQLARDNSLPRPIVKNTELVNHVSGILACVVHCIAARGLLARMTLCQAPEECVRESIFSQIGKEGVIDLKGGEVGCLLLVYGVQ